MDDGGRSMEGSPRPAEAVHQPRYRRDCLGELVQIDGSEHWWFEDRGPRCTLLVFIDDATSRLMHLQFVESESTFDYFAATRAYLERMASRSRSIPTSTAYSGSTGRMRSAGTA